MLESQLGLSLMLGNGTVPVTLRTGRLVQPRAALVPSTRTGGDTPAALLLEDLGCRLVRSEGEKT